jgi:hypothetical protein
MSNNEWKKSIGVVGRMLLAYALVFSQGAWAGQNQKTKDKADGPQRAAAQQSGEKQSSAATIAKAQSNQAQVQESESSVAEEKSSVDGSHEGIKVHGHWTIEVRNPDGTLVTHREFENSLHPLGSNALATFLGRQFSVGFWVINLSGPGICGGNSCNITEPNYAPALDSTFGVHPSSQNLTVGSSTVATSLVLSGSVTSPAAGQITYVGSQVIGCPPTNPPSTPFSSACAGSGGTASFFFTSRPLDGLNGDPQAVSVGAGQLIAVTVNISFS